MRVLIMHGSSHLGLPSGEESVASQEAQELQACNVNVQLVMLPEHAQDPIFPLSVGLGCIWSLRAYRLVSTRIENFRPDVVHFHGLIPYLSASALNAAYKSGVPVIQTLHNGRWFCLEGGFYRNGRYCDDCVDRGGWRGVVHGCNRGLAVSALLHSSNMAGLVGGRLFKWVDKFIAVSDFIREQHERAGFPAEKIVVKNNGIDIAKIDNSFRGTGNRNGFAFVSRISAAKGVNVLKCLIEKINAEIHVVGDGPDLAALKKHCEAGGYRHVRFWGKLAQEHCFSIMSSVVCTVVPSQCGEAFSLVAAESMGLGTPVVGSDIGGLGPLLRNSGGGVPVPPNEPEAFIKAVKSLIANPDSASDLGRCGRRYVESNLNSHQNARRLIEIYESVMKEKDVACC